MSRKVRLFILLSVVLNVVLIGFTAGRGCNRHEIKRGDHIIELLDRSSLPEAAAPSLRKNWGPRFPVPKGGKRNGSCIEKQSLFLRPKNLTPPLTERILTRCLSTATGINGGWLKSWSK